MIATRCRNEPVSILILFVELLVISEMFCVLIFYENIEYFMSLKRHQKQ